MTTKLNVKKVIEVMKEAAKTAKATPKPPFNPVIKPTHRERDMRQDAIDGGSHQAKEYFGKEEGVSNR